MDPLDVEVRHLKELFRSVIDSLPWQQPEWADKDLATYCTSRKNLRSPNVVSKNAYAPRTEPCVALYPTGNTNGSWMFLNIKTKRRVRRTNWQKMVTTELVVDLMNEFSKSEEDAGEVTADDDDIAQEVAEEPNESQSQMTKRMSSVRMKSPLVRRMT